MGPKQTSSKIKWMIVFYLFTEKRQFHFNVPMHRHCTVYGVHTVAAISCFGANASREHSEFMLMVVEMVYLNGHGISDNVIVGFSNYDSAQWIFGQIYASDRRLTSTNNNKIHHQQHIERAIAAILDNGSCSYIKAYDRKIKHKIEYNIPMWTSLICSDPEKFRDMHINTARRTKKLNHFDGAFFSIHQVGLFDGRQLFIVLQILAHD